MSATRDTKKFRDERTIQVINKCISLKDQDIKRNNEILNEILKNVLAAMKEQNEFFRDHFQNLVFVGSYYKGTKVGKPEEFDVNMIIKIPVKYGNIQFEKVMPGYTKLKLSQLECETPKWEKHRKILSKWLTNEGYLNQDAFRQSMEGLLTRAMKQLPTIDNYTIGVRKSGPAFTLWLTKQGSPEMNVDLVPVLEFSCNPPLPSTINGFKWYAVPKPLKNVAEPYLNWRMSFYNYEKNILTKHGSLKPVIRQVKKLRDKQQWTIIPSYHIETLFMHYIRSVEKDSGSPDSKLTGTNLFIHMLDRLRRTCEKQRLENFWDPRHNLIEAEASQLASIVGRLARIIRDITDDPVKMAHWILTPEELNTCQNELKAIRNLPDTNEDSTSRGTSQESEGGSSNDFLTSVYSVSKLVMGVTSALGACSPSSPNEPNNSNAGFSEIMDMLRSIRRDIAGLRDSVDTLSRRMTAVEQRLAPSARSNAQEPSDLAPARFSFDSLFNSLTIPNEVTESK